MKKNWCNPSAWILGAAFGLLVISSSSPALMAQPAAKKPPEVKITLDTAQAPEIASWAEKAKAQCEKFYPTIVRQLGAPNTGEPLPVTITFYKGRGIAATSGNHIGCNADWFLKHPDDQGALIHELCHVVQDYNGARVPSWVTEGIADYVRWFKYEPKDHRPRVNPDRANYTDSYQTTAAFFDWIVRKKYRLFVKRLNAAARDNEYSDDLFRKYAHQPLDKLWEEYVESLKQTH